MIYLGFSANQNHHQFHTVVNICDNETRILHKTTDRNLGDRNISGSTYTHFKSKTQHTLSTTLSISQQTM